MFISSTRMRQPVFMIEIKVSKDKNISRWADRENIYVLTSTSSKLDETASKTVHKDEEGDR